MKNVAKMYNFSSKLWYDKRFISKQGEVSLYLQVTLNRKHKAFPLKIKWLVDRIDMAAGELLLKARGDRPYQDYNMAIRQEQGRHNEILMTYRLKKANIDIIKFAKEVKVYDSKISFASFVPREALKRYNRKEITRRTFQNHTTTYLKMVEFEPVWCFEQLTVAWVKRFRQWLINKDYNLSYVWTVLKNVKAYMAFTEYEPMMHIEEEVIKFKNPEPKYKTTFLTTDEVRQLIKLCNSGYLTEKQNRVLSAFLFSCFTGLRISDVYRVNASWEETQGFLDFILKMNERAGKWIRIPLPDHARDFVKNLNGIYF
ncbi:phage integrase SAM-like domain-containing protein [Mucilaginibacter litoreus]|uniref:Phage integrase SAM-like domain-containing protein n=1 Tax=Mucilaginibacter litoreus TaxID=1048221 RepID=A0ABW3AT30_9SPHI